MNYLQLALLITYSFLVQDILCIHVPVHVWQNNIVYTLTIEENAIVDYLYRKIANALHQILGHDTNNMVLRFRGHELSDKRMSIIAAGVTQTDDDHPVEVIFRVNVSVHVRRINTAYTLDIEDNTSVDELYKTIAAILRQSGQNTFDENKMLLKFGDGELSDKAVSTSAVGITQIGNKDAVEVIFCIPVRVYVWRIDSFYDLNVDENAILDDLYKKIDEALWPYFLHDTNNMVLRFRGHVLSDKRMSIIAAGVTQTDDDHPVEVTFFIDIPVTRNGNSYSIRIKEDVCVYHLYRAIAKKIKPYTLPNVIVLDDYLLSFRGQPLTDRTITLLAARITQHKGDPVDVSIFVSVHFSLTYHQALHVVRVKENADFTVIFHAIADKLGKEVKDIRLHFSGRTFYYNNDEEEQYLAKWYLGHVGTLIRVSYNQIIHLFIESEKEYNDLLHAIPFSENTKFEDVKKCFRENIKKHAHLAFASHVLLNVDNMPIRENDTLMRQNVNLHDNLYIVPRRAFAKDQYVELHVEGEDENTTHQIRYYDYTTPQQIIAWLGRQKSLCHHIVADYILLDKYHRALEQDKKIVDQGVKTHDTVYLVSQESYEKRQMDAGESSRGTKKVKGKKKH